jgi:hypothetical protein
MLDVVQLKHGRLSSRPPFQILTNCFAVHATRRRAGHLPSVTNRLYVKTGTTTVLVNLEGWPEGWKTNLSAVIKFFRDHQCPSFLEYGEYPFVSADEIKKALKLKATFSEMLDLMQSKSATA